MVVCIHLAVWFDCMQIKMRFSLFVYLPNLWFMMAIWIIYTVFGKTASTLQFVYLCLCVCVPLPRRDRIIAAAPHTKRCIPMFDVPVHAPCRLTRNVNKCCFVVVAFVDPIEYQCVRCVYLCVCVYSSAKSENSHNYTNTGSLENSKLVRVTIPKSNFHCHSIWPIHQFD